jgi:flagellar biosynthetic protein FliR
MTEELVQNIGQQAWYVFAVFLRIGPALLMTPGIGERTVSIRIRVLIGLTFASAISPIVQPTLPSEPPVIADLVVFMARESLIGVFFGLFAKGIMSMLEIAGAIISQTVSLSQMFPSNSEPVSIMGHILIVAGLALIFSTPIFDNILKAFVSSYFLTIPSFSEVTGFFADKAAELLDFVFRKGVLLASGFISLFVIYYLFAGFVNKAMAQFMVTFIGIPFVALYSIYFLMIHFQLVLTSWQDKVLTVLMMPFGGF